MVTFDTPQPIISFKWPFRPKLGPISGPARAWVCPTDPTTHEIMFSHLQMMPHDDKMGFQP